MEQQLRRRVWRLLQRVLPHSLLKNQSESLDGTPLLAPKQLYTPSTISQRAPVLTVHGAGGSLLGRRVKRKTLASDIAFVYLDCGTFGKETFVTKTGRCSDLCGVLPYVLYLG